MARSSRHYLCSICKQPRLPASEKHCDIFICGRCDLVMVDETWPTMTEGARAEQTKQDES